MFNAYLTGKIKNLRRSTRRSTAYRADLAAHGKVILAEFGVTPEHKVANVHFRAIPEDNSLRVEFTEDPNIFVEIPMAEHIVPVERRNQMRQASETLIGRIDLLVSKYDPDPIMLEKDLSRLVVAPLQVAVIPELYGRPYVAVTVGEATDEKALVVNVPLRCLQLSTHALIVMLNLLRK